MDRWLNGWIDEMLDEQDSKDVLDGMDGSVVELLEGRLSR